MPESTRGRRSVVMSPFSPRRPGVFGGAATRCWPMEVITVGAGASAPLVRGRRSNGAPRARALVQRAAVGRRAGRRVVAVDLRGHGASAQVPDVEPDATLAAAHDLGAVCDELGWAAPAVAGRSWGGNAVLQLAVDRPPHAMALV